jgi:hypothetical protein
VTSARERDASDEGGDAACWLDVVCPGCGAVREQGPDHRCADEPREGVRRREVPGG